MPDHNVPTHRLSEFEDLFENAPCGYLTMHPDGRIVRVNAQLAAWTGYPADQFIGRRLHDLLTIGTRLLYETSFVPQLLLGGVCEDMSLDLKTADGKTLAVSASGRVRNGEDQSPTLIRVALYKAVERRRYERQLVEAQTQSQVQEQTTQKLLDSEREISELREQFIAVLGHDLRNPLTAMGGGLRLLRKDQPVERRALLCSQLEDTLSRMGGLIDNVLDFARGRLGAGIPLALRPAVLLGPLLEQAVTELWLGDARRVIDTDIDLPLPIQCDPSRISQLVSNLLGNALTHGAANSPVRLHADQANGVLTIWVANSGNPIPEAAAERLFHPFFRGEVRSSQQGLGLGLHIASEIAKAHGGTLDATSTEVETRFTLRMPLSA
jgi:sigma-B regulation protein RsbU (phosphoserine phosphatase)